MTRAFQTLLYDNWMQQHGGGYAKPQPELLSALSVFLRYVY